MKKELININKNEDLDYMNLLTKVKSELNNTKIKVVSKANKELILMYYRIGKQLLNNNKWGSSFIDNLSKDLNKIYPKVKGMSSRNLRYMQKFANIYEDDEFLQEVLANLTWYHNIIIMDKLKDREQIEWYSKNALESGWSSTVLSHQIATNLYSRQAILENKTTNFSTTLSKSNSELSLELLKDPYVFDFISTKKSTSEMEFEEALVNNITKFLIELGESFAFIGRQYHITVNEENYYIDLLFYNIKLHCYVVIELKTVKFKPEFIGQLTFYVNAIDSQLKQENDNSTIGILLCRDKNKLSVEYTLKTINNPIAVAEYKYLEELQNYLNKELIENNKNG